MTTRVKVLRLEDVIPKFVRIVSLLSLGAM